MYHDTYLLFLIALVTGKIVNLSSQYSTFEYSLVDSKGSMLMSKTGENLSILSITISGDLNCTFSRPFLFGLKSLHPRRRWRYGANHHPSMISEFDLHLFSPLRSENFQNQCRQGACSWWHLPHRLLSWNNNCYRAFFLIEWHHLLSHVHIRYFVGQQWVPNDLETTVPVQCLKWFRFHIPA